MRAVTGDALAVKVTSPDAYEVVKAAHGLCTFGRDGEPICALHTLLSFAVRGYAGHTLRPTACKTFEQQQL